MSVDLEALFVAEKALPIQPIWKRRPNDQWLELVSPIDINGVTVQGFQFRASCNRELPDQSVKFQLEYHPLRRPPKGGPIDRIEWRPLGLHNNKGVGPPEFRHKLMRGSHHHPFKLNWAISSIQVRRGSLPVALPITDQLDTFAEALAFVGNEFRINGLMSMPVPPWEGPLF